MPFLAPLPHLTRPLGEVATYKLVGGLAHTDGDVVPSGYRTDLASIPRALHWLLPPASPYEAAAVRHDVRCDALNRGTPLVDSRTTDRAFRHDLRDLGMGPIRRWMMWLGVRLGALVSPTRRPGSLATLPGVLALLVLNLWVVAPTLVCTLAVTILDLIERPARSARRPLPLPVQDVVRTAAA
jgi:hypothetical protein